MPSYWGPFRDNESMSDVTEVDAQINLDLVSVLDQVFDKAVNGEYQPCYRHGEQARVVKGEFKYA